ncbi:MAG: nitroreductase family protein [Syntrophomonadaceae bacterium]|jgi:nitroreductase
MLDLLRRRRSIRKFQERKLEPQQVEQLVKAALMAPSSRARRPWEFIVVQDQELLQKLALCKEHGASFLAEAPLGIVVAADPGKCDVWVEDSSICTMLLHLTATAMGLGSCWIQVRERWHNDRKTASNYVKELLHLPDSLEVLAIVAIGYPAEQKTPNDDTKLPYQKVHYNTFARPFPPPAS